MSYVTAVGNASRVSPDGKRVIVSTFPEKCLHADGAGDELAGRAKEIVQDWFSGNPHPRVTAENLDCWRDEDGRGAVPTQSSPYGGHHGLGREMGESQTRSEAAGPSDTVPAGVESVRV